MDLFAKLRKMSVLLIDDDEWVRDSLRLFFESEGCLVVALETAEEALKMLEQHRFDIVITDYRLPGMDGIEFIKRLPGKAGVRLKIMITAYGSQNIIDQARQAGADDCILKPLSSSAVEASLARLIGRSDTTP